MNEAMKEDNIREYMEPLGITINQNFVYAYTEPGLLSTFTYGAFSALVDMDLFILVFNPKEIVLVGLSKLGNFSGNYVHLPTDDIELLDVKKGLFQYKLELKIKDEKRMKFKVNKIIATSKWQKSNLDFLESVNWYNL